MTKRIKIEGFTLPVEIYIRVPSPCYQAKYGVVTLTKRAEKACGLHRSDFSDCTPRECAQYQAIRKGLREWAGGGGLEWVDLYVDGISLGTVGPLRS